MNPQCFEIVSPAAAPTPSPPPFPIPASIDPYLEDTQVIAVDAPLSDMEFPTGHVNKNSDGDDHSAIGFGSTYGEESKNTSDSWNNGSPPSSTHTGVNPGQAFRHLIGDLGEDSDVDGGILGI